MPIQFEDGQSQLLLEDFVQALGAHGRPPLKDVYPTILGGTWDEYRDLARRADMMILNTSTYAYTGTAEDITWMGERVEDMTRERLIEFIVQINHAVGRLVQKANLLASKAADR